MLSLHKELPLSLDFWETGFRAELATNPCVGCGQCADKCPVQAMSFPELAHKKQPLARTRVVGKLAKGVIVKRDLRLLKN